MKEHFHHHNVDKDKESLRNEVTKVKKQIVSGEHIALHQRSELQKLARIIQEADEERQRQVQQQEKMLCLRNTQNRLSFSVGQNSCDALALHCLWFTS